MIKLTESAIEDFAIKLFERLGYDYIHARMATDCSQLKRAVTNGKRIQLSGNSGQLSQTVSNRGNCPVIPDSSRATKIEMVAMRII